MCCHQGVEHPNPKEEKLSDENVTPADLAEQAAAKEQQPTHEPETEQTTEQAETTTNNGGEVDELRKQLARFEAENRKLKDENGDRRVKAKKAEEQAETIRKIAQALGFEPSDDDPEAQIKQAKHMAEQSAQERDKLQAELNRMREDAALRRLAEEHGAEPKLLAAFLRDSGDLPKWGDDAWDSKAAELVTSTLKAFPQIRAGGVPRTSGNAPSPTQNNDHVITAEELAEMTSDQIYKAAAQGKLKHLY